jgi:hypothetical protein
MQTFYFRITIYIYTYIYIYIYIYVYIVGERHCALNYQNIITGSFSRNSISGCVHLFMTSADTCIAADMYIAAYVCITADRPGYSAQ